MPDDNGAMQRSDPMQPQVRVDAQNRRLCHAHSKRTGELCQAPAMLGQRVCRMHGGSIPAARANAKVRLLEAVDIAVAVLIREMAQADKSADRQRAANSILDRAGIARTIATADGEAARQLLVERLTKLRAERGLPPLEQEEDWTLEEDAPDADFVLDLRGDDDDDPPNRTITTLRST